MDARSESYVFTVRSKSGKKIHLTKTTWVDKMLRDHPELGARREYLNELRRTVEDPDYIISGWFGEHLALRFCEVAPRRPEYLCVVYRERNEEGFVITAFFISKPYRLLRRGMLWRKLS